MKIEISDTCVNIKIPNYIPWFKQAIIEEIHKKGYFGDGSADTILNNYKYIRPFEISKNIFQKKVQNIGIWCSGGADSSILLYCLAYKIQQENLDIQIQPFSVRRQRPANPLYASNVVDHLQNIFNTEKLIIKDIICYYPTLDDSYLTEHKIFWIKNIENFITETIEVQYSGITSNPPPEANLHINGQEHLRDTSVDRPLETSCYFSYYINPFFQVDKSFVAKLYKYFNVMETLFPLTRSCEGEAHDTDNFTKHCGKCWWCRERLWAFDRLI